MATPLSLSLEDLRARPAVEAAVTMECAGNGRVLIEPHVVSQPWLEEAVGTAVWRGTPLRGLLSEAGVTDDAVELVFTGLDHGLEGGIEQAYQRSLSLMDAHRPEVLLAYEMNGAPLAPQHGFPLRLLVPGWYGMTSVKWLGRITAVDRPFEGYQQSHSYRLRQDEEEAGEPVSRILPRALMVPPGFPEFPTRSRIVPAGPHLLEGTGVVGPGRARVGGGLDRRRRRPGLPPTRGRSRLAVGVAALDVHVERDGRRVRALLPRAGRGGERAAARARVEPRRLREQRRAARARHRRLNDGRLTDRVAGLARRRVGTGSRAVSWRRICRLHPVPSRPAGRPHGR